MIPKHIDKVPEYIEEIKILKDGSTSIEQIPRRAVAPYNFIELPDQVVTVEPDSLPSGDRYHLNRHTGRIECILTTESPLYTRCGWNPEDFAKYGETPFKDLSDKIQKLRANFFINPATNQPVIPGSSIRGMLRTLVEIVSFSKIDRVSGHQRLFFRAVGSNSNKESWGQKYKQYVKPEILKAGYLIKNGETWLIQTAIEDKGVTFAWVEESDLVNFPDFKYLNDRDYKPQYLNANYDSQFLAQRQIKRKGKIVAEPWFASNIEFTDSDSSSKLVTSGNMKQTDDGNSPRSNHCIVFPQDHKATPLPIDDTAIEHYRNALTEFQKALPFDKDWGVLKEGHPVFYYHDGQSETVGFFGQSPNFRIPYSPEGNGHATTVLDFIPTAVNNPYVINWNNAPISFSLMLLNINLLVGILFVAIPLIDITDAIFGWVKQESKEKKLPKIFDKQRTGRIFVTDALCENNEDDIGYSKNSVTPKILSEPKPSYFSHYLVQPEETNADPKNLKHYASEPLDESVIRGHKLYWHKGNDPDFKLKRVIGSSQKVSETQKTLIKPIKKGVTFKFDISFENLSDVELGALLWVLSLSSDKLQQLGTGKTSEKYCFSLGMGKPLGMGAVKIDYNLHLSDRSARYNQLFNGDRWSQDEQEQDEVTQAEINCISEFEKYVLDRISENDYPDNQNRQQLEHLRQIPRIEMLLAMLQCDPPEEAAYMELEKFKDRKVLPTPLDIRNIEDNRRFPTNSTPSSKTAPKPKPQKKSTRPKQEPENKVNLATQRAPRPPKPKR